MSHVTILYIFAFRFLLIIESVLQGQMRRELILSCEQFSF